MNEESEHHHSHDRSAAKAHFVARLNRYRDLLQRRWWVLALGAFVGLGVEAAVSMFQPHNYVSTGRMIVNIKMPGVAGEMQTYSDEVNNFLGTQAALMQSEVVQGRAYEKALLLVGNRASEPDPGAPSGLSLATNSTPPATNQAATVSSATASSGANAPAQTNAPPMATPGSTALDGVGSLAGANGNTNLPKVRLKVTVTPKTSIFVLEGTGNNRRFTQAFVQGCMDEYTSLKKDMVGRTTTTTIVGMEEEAMRLGKELRECDDEIVAFQSTNSLVWLEQQGNSVGNYLVALNQQLAQFKSEYSLLTDLTLDQNISRQQQELAATPSGADPAADSNNSPLGSDTLATDYLHAKQALMLMKQDLKDLEVYLRPKHPKIRDMKEEIARRETLLGIYRDNSKDQLENRKATVALKIVNLEKEIKEWDTKILDLGRKTAEYQRMKANSQRIQSLYDHLLSTMQSLDVNKGISPESVTVMEAASAPVLDRPGEIKKLIAAGLGCVVLSIGFLLLLDYLDDRVNSFTELQELFDENVLVQIPRERAKGKRGELELVQPDDARHSFLEAYRNLRSSLLYMSESGKRPKTLLLTSSVPNEGKSLTASNLAITIAQAGTRVLLVDADLRKGLLHRRFDLKAEPGFCEVLGDGLDWKPLVQATGFANLSLLARGSTTQQSSEFFLNEATDRFLKEASEAYGMVILDTAPVMAADDVTSLAPLTDGALFVLRAQHTSARVARAALELLYQRQVNVIGLVFNAVRPSSVDYYYYYKYKDYYYKDYHKSDGASEGGDKGGKGERHRRWRPASNRQPPP